MFTHQGATDFVNDLMSLYASLCIIASSAEFAAATRTRSYCNTSPDRCVQHSAHRQYTQYLTETGKGQVV